MAPVPPTPPLPRRSARHLLRDVILARILDGAYPPGHRLRELALAAEFQTSQAPVREALRELEALRYVETRPNRGTYVPGTGLQEFLDSCRVRAVLEREIAEEAAPRADVAWLAGLCRSVDGIEAAASADDVAAYAGHDYAFHRAIAERAGNPVLLHHWEQIVVPTRALVVQRVGAVHPAETAPEHRPILDALAAGDGARAGALAFAHADGMRGRILRRARGGAPGPAGVTLDASGSG